MPLELINAGTEPNDGTGDPPRQAAQKINGNFQTIESGLGELELATAALSSLTADIQGGLGQKLEADALTPYETTAQLDTRDTANRDRDRHTGTQGAATIADFASAAAAAAPVQSVAGKGGAVSLTKTDVGLGQVDNTSDAAKPISAATQAALDLKIEADALTTFETSTQLNERDTANRARGNHTGTQPANTVSGLAAVATSGAYSDLTGKPTIPAGFTYDQQVEPVGPTAGQTWRERSAGGLIVGQWEWSGSLWLTPETTTDVIASQSGVAISATTSPTSLDVPIRSLGSILITRVRFSLFFLTSPTATDYWNVGMDAISINYSLSVAGSALSAATVESITSGIAPTVNKSPGILINNSLRMRLYLTKFAAAPNVIRAVAQYEFRGVR